jgi:hypothetical protein
MRKLIAAAAVATALAAAGTASAGCFATAGLSPMPDGVAAGETWRPSVVVRQHGERPMADAAPIVLITNPATGETARFPATLADAGAGRYTAEVVFPTGGEWQVAVNDGFPVAECATTHTFGSVTIGGAPAPPAEPPAPAAEPAAPLADSGSSFPVAGVAAGAAAGLLALVAAALGLRMRRGRAAARPA